MQVNDLSIEKFRRSTNLTAQMNSEHCLQDELNIVSQLSSVAKYQDSFTERLNHTNVNKHKSSKGPTLPPYILIFCRH